MQRQVFLALLAGVSLALALGAPGTRAQTVEPRTLDDPEAYAVYASLLPNEWALSRARAKRLVFQKETSAGRGCFPTGAPLQDDWKPVADNFRSENASQRALREGFALGVPYVVVPSAEIRALFADLRDDGWGRFYQRYPDSGGYIAVSAVGFDAEKRRAMVHFGSVYGMLGANWKFFFLNKTDAGWRETRIPGVSNCLIMS
jgi:hypothetical protein